MSKLTQGKDMGIRMETLLADTPARS